MLLKKNLTSAAKYHEKLIHKSPFCISVGTSPSPPADPDPLFIIAWN